MKMGRELVAEIEACEVGVGQCAFWWLGQHGFVVKLGRTVLYIDAFLMPMKARNVAPLLKPEEVTNASAVLGTHDHVDHIDRPSWPGMMKASPAAKFIVPQAVRAAVARDLGFADGQLIGLDEGIETTIGDVKITAIPAAHELLDTDEKGPASLPRLYRAGQRLCAVPRRGYLHVRGYAGEAKAVEAGPGVHPHQRARRGEVHAQLHRQHDLPGGGGPGGGRFGRGSPCRRISRCSMATARIRSCSWTTLKAKYPGLRAQVPVHGEKVMVGK